MCDPGFGFWSVGLNVSGGFDCAVGIEKDGRRTGWGFTAVSVHPFDTGFLGRRMAGRQ